MQCRYVVTPDDLAELDRLFRRCHAADSHWPLGEHEYLDLVQGTPGKTAGLVFEQEGHIVGYAHVTSTPVGEARLGVAVDPLHRSTELVTMLLEDAMEEARRSGNRLLRFWVFQPAIAGILHHHGFDLERELRQLRCDLPNEPPPDPPDGYELRTFRVGIDEALWLHVNNRAFDGHPENGAWTAEILADRQRQPWFDPDGFLMLWRDDHLAGFCWTKVHDDGVGEIYVIAVNPLDQRRGLGRLLALAGLDYLAGRQSCTTGMLYVDAANDRALALYEKLGFWMDHVDRSFVACLDVRS